MKSWTALVKESPPARSTFAAILVILAVGFVLYLNSTRFDSTEGRAIIEIAIVVVAREVFGIRRE